MEHSEQYREAREELRRAEIALKEQRERVAELRRRLPLEAVVEDHELSEAAGDATSRTVRLSELFVRPELPLVIVHFMFGKKQTEPCPMCTLCADGYTGVLDHVSQCVNFVVVVAGDVVEFARYAQGRGWDGLRVVSSGETSFKHDLGMEDSEGAQMPGVTVLERADDGRILHFYTGGAMMGDGHYRGMDLLMPLWNFLDLTRQGRGEFFPRIAYE
jgi:predicted dithiol-disulfide oxidoreductase (DUF899 family)